MKKMSELLKEINFNPNASDAVKEAFIKHLIKQTTATNAQSPSEKKIISENLEKFISFSNLEKYALPAQLAFSFDNEQFVTKKKTAV